MEAVSFGQVYLTPTADELIPFLLNGNGWLKRIPPVPRYFAYSLPTQ